MKIWFSENRQLLSDGWITPQVFYKSIKKVELLQLDEKNTSLETETNLWKTLKIIQKKILLLEQKMTNLLMNVPKQIWIVKGIKTDLWVLPNLVETAYIKCRRR